MAKAKKKQTAMQALMAYNKELADKEKKAGKKAAEEARKNPRKTAMKVKAAKSKIKKPKATKTESTIGKGVKSIYKNIFETSGSKEYAAKKKKKKG